MEGVFLPKGTPPDPRSNPNHDDWEPFADEVEFLIADFLYRQEEMSFSSYECMYSAIDDIKHGDAPWKSFTTSYAGELGPNAHSWQLQDYEVWFRDPDVVIRNMLDNPDFDGHFDYAPYVDLDKDGNRKWNEFLSGTFSWRHAVSVPQCFCFCKILFNK